MEEDASDCSRPRMLLFGCTLTSDEQEFKVDAEDSDAEQQLSLKVACLGAEAEDEFHMVEVEGLTYNAKTTKVPLVVLKPSVIPSMNFGSFEITPPVTFRLRLGTGPVHISGQHFVSEKDSADKEKENNTSPVKRPATMSSGKKSALKKLKMDSDDSEDDEDDEDSEEDDDDEDGEEVELQSRKKLGKVFEKTADKPNKITVNHKSSSRSFEATVKHQPHTSGKDKLQAGPSNSPSLSEIKNKLSAATKEGKPLPKTEQKFENFAKSSFKITDKQVVKELWNFLQMLKMQKK